MQLSSRMTQMQDAHLRSLLDASPPRAGWGRNHTLDIGGSTVFVKRVPVTDREYDNLLSTKNLYGLPTYYNYGVGSGGFGAFRELAAHEKTTRWVLEGEIASFPLLHHWRILAGRVPSDSRFQVDDYVRKWNGSVAVARYMKARAAASHELWLVLEHFPHTVSSWLRSNQPATGRVIEQLCRTIEYLGKHGVVHFDAHLANVVGDGQDVYLTDFGLLLDPDFDLSESERAFLARHSRYDYGEALASVGALLLDMLQAMEPEGRRRLEERYGVAPGAGPDAALATLLDRLEHIQEAGDLPVERGFVDAVTPYRDVIVFMSHFLTTLRRNPRKDTKYDDAALGRLLDAAGVIA